MLPRFNRPSDMVVYPDYELFAQTYDKGLPQILLTRLVADLETPVSAMLKLSRNAKYSFLLESVEGGSVRGRYSIIGMNPDVIWRVKNGVAAINRKALLDTDEPFEALKLDPLSALRALLAESRIDLPSDDRARTTARRAPRPPRHRPRA